PDSYNYELGNSDLPLYALDLRHIPTGPVSNWMNGPHPFFEIGAVYSPVNEKYSYTPTDLPQQFDVIISIQKVTASHLIPLKM
ncbi:MAG: erythromycin esterase family protein, partial [Ktedonobacteraceae bacterium]